MFRLLRRTFYFLLVTVSIVLAVVYYYMEFGLPDIDALNSVQLQVPLQILTRDGKLIAQYGEKRRIPIPFNQIPQPLINAVLATEDQRYFQHAGIDIPGLMRASIKLILTGRKEEGGSTITMQVARSFYLTRHKTFGRKIREILLALKINRKLSKEKILELYLNKIFLGERAYGVEAAAEVYYGKSLSQLTLDEYAMLAGLPKAPSALNPISNPDAAIKRRDHVLGRMYELNYITKKEYLAAIRAPLNAKYHDLKTEVKAPYMAELVRQQLEQMYGDDIYTEGYRVYTTIDARLQEAANKAVRDKLIAYDQRHGYRGSKQNLGMPDLNRMQGWEKILSNIRTVNGLEPAAVVDMTKQTVTVLRSNGELVVIPWEGLSWARKQLNADYLGRMPSKASDIVKQGDVVRIVQNSKGWRLTQIPKAEAGLVALSPTNGEILALVGGFDYQSSKFNRITTAQRQPGSAFKPFVYSAALEKGYTLATVINDAPIVIENRDNSLWRPQNENKKFYGPTRLREALIHSRNLVSIRLLDLVSIPYAIDYAQRFGFTAAQLPPGLSLALGTALVTPLQMATAYAVFANGGYRIVPFAIDIIRNPQQQIVYQAKPITVCENCSSTKANSNAPRVISPQNAYLMTSALHDVIQHGTAFEARSLKRDDLAGKTGTTNNQVDAWFAGYNRDIVAVAWIGFDQQQQSLHEYGAKAALPVWMEFMQTALKGVPERPLDQPPGIVSIRVDPYSGRRTSDESSGIFEYFMSQYTPDSEQTARPTDTPTRLQGGEGDEDQAKAYQSAVEQRELEQEQQQQEGYLY